VSLYIFSLSTPTTDYDNVDGVMSIVIPWERQLYFRIGQHVRIELLVDHNVTSFAEARNDRKQSP
jgi:hypothetical protein